MSRRINRHEEYRFVIFRLSFILVGVMSLLWLPACGVWEAINGSGPDLYVMDADGSHRVKLGVIGSSPAWSPDGSTIAFVWIADKPTPEPERQIKVVKADGTGLRSLTREMTAPGGLIPFGTRPAWSRDGKRIAFQAWQRYASTPSYPYIVVNADGSNPEQVDRLTEPYLGFGMSPDGKKQVISVVKTGYNEIYVKEIGGTGQTLVGKFVYGTGGWWGEGSWFADSKRIAFTHWSGPVSKSYDIYVVNDDGNGLGKLGAGSAPVVSPDGSKIAFLQGGDIWVMNSDGSNRIQLTSSSANEYSPAWSPDGKRIVFVVDRSGILSNPL